jgi:tight adherence protein B
VGPWLLIALAAAAGGLAAMAAREGVLAAPRAGAWVAAAARPLARAGREGYAPSAAEQRRLGVLGSGAILASVVFAFGPGPLAVAAAAGPVAAASLVARRRERYRRAVERSIPDVAIAVADSISSGASVRMALAGAAASLEGAPARELARVGAELELGAPTATALAAMRGRMRSPRVDGLVGALLSQQLAGGDLAGLMRRLGKAAAESDRVADDARAATAQARFTGLLVVAMPAGAGIFAELLDPGFVSRVIADPAGVVLLAVAGALQLAGFASIRRLGRPEEAGG